MSLSVIGSNATTNLKNLFKAPMEAVIEADIQLCQSISQFILEFGFNDVQKDGELGDLKVVSFDYPDDDGHIATVTIPVLSLIQLPLLQIKDADFDMNVKLFTFYDDNNTPANNDEFSFLNPDKKPSLPICKVQGALAPEGNGLQESMKSNMKVTLKMVQSDMPGGLINILSMLNNMPQLKKRDNRPNND
ncbi:hypothetical protein FUAX_53270 (plasmid) [Fulvitalea axinellae]|uniref:DUF2589 domain-containing protein n=1 Tax=Fulvitalea axinellae TaxID=1182444 RepID=A0AAU9DNW2_9BACT|nr:hypothetical protein FUAX_53270 [Fulvitalea axinellae]